MAIETLVGKVVSKTLVAKDTYALRITSEGKERFDFLPGQFVTITVQTNIRRSYSISSIPGKNYFELIADTVRGGPGSQFFMNIKEGDYIEFLFPLGVFFYHEDNERPAYFFGTGTGLVPLISMIEYALTVSQTKRDIFLYAGFRFIEDVFSKELLELLDVHYENFIFKLNLTQPTEDWKGPVGRITQYTDALPDNNIDAYICGSNQMVEDIKARLIEKGVPKEQIFHEMFY
jgi:NAD(P)H-flavin reductase